MYYFGRTTRALFTALFALAFASGASALQKLNPIQRAPGDQDVAFEVYLPLQNTDALKQLLVSQQTPGSNSYHKWLTPQDFQKNFGPSQKQIDQITSVLQGYGFTVTKAHSQGVHVVGKISSVESTFSASLWTAKTLSGAERLTTSEPVTLPSALSAAGAQILHFTPIIRKQVNSQNLGKLPDSRYSPFGPYWFDDLKQAYEFPSYEALTGQGRTIAIVMSSDFQDSDIAAYFAHEKLTPPTIVRRRVLRGATFDAAKNPGSLEVELDLEQAGGMAPGAQLMLYNIPDLGDDSILGAYLDIVEENRADIVSSSFGGPEGLYTAAYNGGVDKTGVLRVFNQLFQQGNAQGITFVASSGDSGALGLPPLAYFTTPPPTPPNPPVVVGNFELGIETPASDPNVTAVGGTAVLKTTSNAENRDSAYLRESAFADPMLPEDPYGTGNLVAGGYFGPGGGKSVVFQKPAYQRLVKTGSKMRTVPDISLLCG
ncbi:MAG: protease pro-enzyme activation domain-containing protein, partial [Acidobacteriota bacterium]|nr:protease pro-enzyme activation domain-containing protein [Acidobacteriota bacterium]